jgi:kinesin family protein 1
MVAVYTWDHAKFAQQLVKMRHVRALKERPNYSLHFRNEGTFSNPDPPSDCFVGVVKAPLRLLANQISHDMTLPIICPYTMEAIGSCRVSFNLPFSGSSGLETPESGSRPLRDSLPVGKRFSFDFALTSIKGISSASFATIHAQVRLSSLVGPDIASDDVYISQAIDLNKTSAAHLALRKSLTVIVSPDMLKYMADGYASIHFFAQVRPEYLMRLKRWDVTRESAIPSARAAVQRGLDSPARPPMRRCETDFLGLENHDILATISVLELSSSGSYEAVEVLGDTFQLHQGVQRRLAIQLGHSSGKRLQWSSIEHVTMSNVRIASKGQTTIVSEQEVKLSLQSETPDFAPDGSSTLQASGTWDTAAHASIHLDRRTSSDTTIIVRLSFLVQVESLHEPASFALDLPIRIVARESRRSSLLSYFSTERAYTSLTAVYRIELIPPIAQSTQDLWRLDTAGKHVPGEEVLGDWRPRTISLLEDWQRACKTARAIADKQSTMVVLDLLSDLGSAESDIEDENLMRRCVALWQKQLDERHLVSPQLPLHVAVKLKIRSI